MANTIVVIMFAIKIAIAVQKYFPHVLHTCNSALWRHYAILYIFDLIRFLHNSLSDRDKRITISTNILGMLPFKENLN